MVGLSGCSDTEEINSRSTQPQHHGENSNPTPGLRNNTGSKIPILCLVGKVSTLIPTRSAKLKNILKHNSIFLFLLSQKTFLLFFCFYRIMFPLDFFSLFEYTLKLFYPRPSSNLQKNYDKNIEVYARRVRDAAYKI